MAKRATNDEREMYGDFASEFHYCWFCQHRRTRPVIDELRKMNVRVSLFMDPDPAGMRLAREIGADRVELPALHCVGERGRRRVGDEREQCCADRGGQAARASREERGPQHGQSVQTESG